MDMYQRPPALPIRFAQHGTGFVGEAVIAAVNTVCADVAVLGIDPDHRKVETLHERYGIPAGTPADVELYRDCNVHSFSVPTPADPRSYWGYDLSYLIAALEHFAHTILTARDEHTLIIIRSTVYPGTTEEILIPLLEDASGKRCGTHFDVAYNPEFLAQATAHEDALNPPLIAAACSSERGAHLFAQCFESFNVPFQQFPGFRDAEWLKLANNVANAMFISTMNELRESMVRDGLSPAAAEKVSLTLAKTSFVKSKATYGLRDLGPYGGACLPKETSAMLACNQQRGYPSALLAAAIQLNQSLEHARASLRPVAAE